MKGWLMALLALAALAAGVRSATAVTADLVVRAEKLATILDMGGRDPQPGDSRDLRPQLPRMRELVPQLEAYSQRHPHDARALVVLARLRYSQIEFETASVETGAPAIHADQTVLDLVVPLVDSALVIEPRLASAWYWKARILGRPALYVKEHRHETLSWINPDNNRALPAAARAVQLVPDQPLYRELYESLLKATGRTEEEYRAHPLADEPWRTSGSLAGLEEELDQVPIPGGAVLLESVDLQGATNGDPRSGGRGVLRTRQYAVPASFRELERHFAGTWPGLAWREVKPEDLAADPVGALFAPAISDTTNGRVRMFTSSLEWRSEDGQKRLTLPWGEGPDFTEGISLLAIELTGKVGGDRVGPLASIHTDPYCLLKLVNRRNLR
jgi:hypothetical protein